MEMRPPDDIAAKQEVRKGKIDLEALAKMSLEALLYYVLAGDGRRLKSQAA